MKRLATSTQCQEARVSCDSHHVWANGLFIFHFSGLSGEIRSHFTQWDSVGWPEASQVRSSVYFDDFQISSNDWL